MKKLQLLLPMVFCLISTFSGAQSILEEGNRWNFVEHNSFSPTSSFSLRLEGDTIIDNLRYKKIMRSRDALQLEWLDMDRYLREDDKKVYLKKGNSDEQILYNFGLEVGDTLMVDEHCSVVVTEVDTIAFGSSDARRRLTVAGLNGWGVSQ